MIIHKVYVLQSRDICIGHFSLPFTTNNVQLSFINEIKYVFKKNNK